jgi:predicted permease
VIRPRIRRLFRLAIRRSDLVQREVQDEIAAHIALRAEQLVRQGYSPADATAEALRRFGPLEPSRAALIDAAQHREVRMRFRERLDVFAQDQRFAARGLRREPLLAAFIVITFALGIGVNAAMFGVVDRLMLSGPAHVTEQDQLVQFFLTVQPPGMNRVTTGTFGYVTYDAMRRGTRSFDGVAAYKVTREAYTLGRGLDARQLHVGAATADLFPLLGVSPFFGRFFTPDEDRTSGAERVVVLSHALWESEFGGDRGVIGATITLNNESFTVVGVAPDGFTGPQLGPVDVWVPMSHWSRNVSSDWPTAWDAQWLQVIGRLRPGVAIAQANADLTTALRAAYTGDEAEVRSARMLAWPLGYLEDGREPPELAISRWLVGVAMVVLVIACSNVVNLLLARALRRRREVAVRVALGAGRSRLVGLLLTEGLMLALLGGIAGVAVAWVTGQLMRTTLLPDVAWVSSAVSGRVLLVSLFIAVALGVIAGLVPAWRASRPNLTSDLKSGVREGGGAHSRLRSALTVAQAALSVLLLVGAGLFVRSLERVRALDLGVEADRVLVTRMRWPRLPAGATEAQQEAENARRRGVYLRAVERIRSIPGVEHASLAVGLSFQMSFSQRVRVPGWDTLPSLGTGSPRVSAVTSDYFETVGTRLLRGRAFTPADGAGSEPITIVNETMARTLWPNRDPIGECFYAGDARDVPCARIVGIAADARRFQLRERPGMHYYLPFGQERGFGGTVLVVRPTGAPAALVPALRSALAEVDAGISYVDVELLQESVDPQIRPWRLGAAVFGMMGVLALLVAAVGLYSVLSYVVAQRRHEMGVRLALGATGGAIARLVMRSSFAMAAAGIAIGLALALAGGRFIAPLLFDTSPRDSLVLAVVTISLVSVAILASILPGLRARRVDPMEAMRVD